MEEETGICTPRDRRGRGPGTQGRIHRDNIGKIPLAAGAGRNLQRLPRTRLRPKERRASGIDESVSKSDDRGVMSSQEAVHVSLMEVVPTSGKGTLGTWWCHRQRGGRTQSRPQPTHAMALAESKPFAAGAYANQRLNLAVNGKAHGRNAKASNRTWETRPSGIIGGVVRKNLVQSARCRGLVQMARIF